MYYFIKKLNVRNGEKLPANFRLTTQSLSMENNAENGFRQ